MKGLLSLVFGILVLLILAPFFFVGGVAAMQWFREIWQIQWVQGVILFSAFALLLLFAHLFEKGMKSIEASQNSSKSSAPAKEGGPQPSK